MKSLTILALMLASLAPARANAPKKEVEEGQLVVFLSDSRPLLLRFHVKNDDIALDEAWNDFITNLFERLDTNKNGKLDASEAKLIPAPVELFSSRALYIRGGQVTGADLDKDGTVTRAELAEFYRKNGGSPFQLAGGNPNEMSRRVALDYTGLLPSLGGQAEALTAAIVKLLDTNGDGKLSHAELTAADKRLLTKDADDDAIIMVGELLNEAPSDGTYQLILGGQNLSPLPDGSPFLLTQPRGPDRKLGQKLLMQYARSEEAKKTSTLTAKDIGLDKDAFRELDADDNGKLDAEELARFARRTPDVEIDVQLGKEKSFKVRAIEGRKAFAGAKNQAGVAVVEIDTTTIEFKVIQEGQTGGMFFAPQIVDSNDFTKMQFTQADQDKNGYLDEKEAARSGFIAGNFKAIDADGDGKLYLKEVQAFRKKQQGLNEMARAACATLSVTDQGRGLFDLIDLDKDGRLSVREMRLAVELLKKLDRDSDGALTTAEIPRRFAASARKGPMGGDGNLYGPFALVGAPGIRGAPTPRKEGPLWFRKMDRNRDGDVSRKEFLGTAEQFQKIDTDKDDLISVLEAEVFEKSLRK